MSLLKSLFKRRYNFYRAPFKFEYMGFRVKRDFIVDTCNNIITSGHRCDGKIYAYFYSKRNGWEPRWVFPNEGIYEQMTHLLEQRDADEHFLPEYLPTVQDMIDFDFERKWRDKVEKMEV